MVTFFYVSHSLFLSLLYCSGTLIVRGEIMNTLTIELPKETAEKLDLLKQAYEKENRCFYF